MNLVDPNSHAGVKYIQFVIDRCYKDEPMDNLNQHPFAFAAPGSCPSSARSP